MLSNPTSKLTKKQPLAQCSNIRKQKLVLQVEISKAMARRSQEDMLIGDIITSEIGWVPSPKTSPDRLNTRKADMRLKVISKLGPLPTTKAKGQRLLPSLLGTYGEDGWCPPFKYRKV